MNLKLATMPRDTQLLVYSMLLLKKKKKREFRTKFSGQTASQQQLKNTKITVMFSRKKKSNMRQKLNRQKTLLPRKC